MTSATDTIVRKKAARRPRSAVDAGLIVAAIGLLGLIVYTANYLWHATPPRDQSGFILGRDFVNTWMGARAVLAGTVRDVLNVDVHNHLLRSTLGPMPPHNWSYPPSLFLFIWPLGFLSYTASLALWSVAGLAAYLGAAASHDRSPRFLILVAAAPPIAVNLFSGQTGFFTAAILILFFRFLDKRPVVAGVLLALMICKPHLAVLFPLALAVSGRWRTFAAAGAGVVLLLAITTLVFGAPIWTDYFRLVVPVQRGVLEYGTGFLSMMPTGFMHARMLGAPLWIAWMVQAPFSVLALAAVVWTFARRRDPLLSAGVLLTASVIVSPYAFAYDMVVFGWLIAMLWPRLRGWTDRILLLMVWTLPVTMLGLDDFWLPFAAPLMAGFLVWLVFLIRNQEAAPCPIPAGFDGAKAP